MEEFVSITMAAMEAIAAKSKYDSSKNTKLIDINTSKNIALPG